MKDFFGTSSWSSRDWIGNFYPQGTTSGEMLSYYATQFPAVEADVTYYRIPSEKMIVNWKMKTPEGFMIAAKFPREIVHGGKDRFPDGEQVLNIKKIGDITKTFLDRVSGLEKRCGPLVLQMPYYNQRVFRQRDEFLNRLETFLSWLPKSFSYAVEIRNRNYLGADLFELLKSRKIPLVMVDIPYMPWPGQWGALNDVITGDFAYLRLIGDRKTIDKQTKKFDQIVVDHTDHLQAWAQWFSNLRTHVNSRFVFANNHFAGHGPSTIRQFALLLSQLES